MINSNKQAFEISISFYKFQRLVNFQLDVWASLFFSKTLFLATRKGRQQKLFIIDFLLTTNYRGERPLIETRTYLATARLFTYLANLLFKFDALFLWI